MLRNTLWFFFAVVVSIAAADVMSSSQFDDFTVEQRIYTVNDSEIKNTSGITPTVINESSLVVTPTAPFTSISSSSQVNSSFGFLLNQEFWMNVLSNAAGALIGALLAIPTGLWLDRRIKLREQNRDVEVILTSIYEEIARNINSLNDFISKASNNEEEAVVYPSVTNDAWQAVQSSRLIADFPDYSLRKDLISAYEKIAFIEQISQSLWNMLFSTNSDFILLNKKVSLLQKELKREAIELLPYLDRLLLSLETKGAKCSVKKKP